GSVEPPETIYQIGLPAAARSYYRDHAACFDFEIAPAERLYLHSAELVGFDEGVYHNWYGGHANLTVLLIFDRSFRAAVIAGRKTPRNNRPIIARIFSEAHSGKTTLRGARRLE